MRGFSLVVETPKITSSFAVQYSEEYKWPLFPLKFEEGKLVGDPAQATTARSAIQSWWNGKSTCPGLGLPTGQRSGIVILEADREGVESLRALEEVRKILEEADSDQPSTAYQFTPARHMQVFFRYEGTPLASGMILRGVRLLAEGEATALYPTCFPNGGVYRWRDYDETKIRPLLPLPACIIRKARPQGREDIPEAVPGPNTSGQKENGANHSVLDLLASPSPDKATAPETVWLFPRRHFAVLASDPGRGKSILSMKACADLSIGGSVLGGKAEPARRILFLNGEASKGIFDYRFRSSGWAFDPERFKVIHQEQAQEAEVDLSLDTLQGRDNFESLCQRHRPDLCVIDSLPAFSSIDMNDGQAMNAIAKFLKGLASRHDMALLLIHHLRKRRTQDNESEISLNEIQGSNATLKLAGTVVGIEEKRGTDDEGEKKPVRIVKCLKTWLRAFPDFSYEIGEDENERLTLSINYDPPSELKRASAWDRIKRAFSNGAAFKREAVEDVCQVSMKTAKKYLGDWVALGRLERIGSGKGTEYRILSG